MVQSAVYFVGVTLLTFRIPVAFANARTHLISHEDINLLIFVSCKRV